MRPLHYYNEFEPYAAAWLRNLISAGHLPAGEVDERSIVDVAPDDLRPFRQCHFFAGIGGWALAARLAGWPEDRELWTGSAPCQPFSVAGKGAGADDSRHLWPHYFRLIDACRPAVAMGEQVAAAVGKHWLDGVCSDLEGIGYACGAAIVPACAVNAPHRRDRLWFVARYDATTPHGLARALDHSERSRLEGLSGHDGAAQGRQEPNRPVAEAGGCGPVEHADQSCASEKRPERGGQLGGAGCNSEGSAISVAHAHSFSGKVDPNTAGCANGSGAGQEPGLVRGGAGDVSDAAGGREREPDDQDSTITIGRATRPVSEQRSHWDGAGWIIGHDGKARRVGTRIRRVVDGLPADLAGVRAGEEPTAALQEEEIEMIPLLAHGVQARVGKLRALGNAIVPQEAAEVIGAYLDVYGVTHA